MHVTISAALLLNLSFLAIADGPVGSHVRGDSNRRSARPALSEKEGACATPLPWGVTRHFEMYGAKTEADMEKLAKWGIDQFIIDGEQLIPKANALKARVVLANWFEPNSPWAAIEARLKFAKKVDHLVSVNLMDEPINNGPDRFPPEYYVALKEKIKLQYPDLPLSITQFGPAMHWPPHAKKLFQGYLPAIDRLRIDPYPVIAGQPLRAVSEWITHSRLLMKDRQLPLTVVIQTWSTDSVKPALPTIAQLRVMAYQAMLHGADALSFFDYNPEVWKAVPGFEKGFIDLLKELVAFSKKYADYRICDVRLRGDLLVATLKNDKETVTLKINTSEVPLDGLAPTSIGF